MVTATNAPAAKNAAPVLMPKSVQSQVVIMSGPMLSTAQMAVTTDIATPVNQTLLVASIIMPNNAKRLARVTLGIQARCAHLVAMAMVYVTSATPEIAAAMAIIKRSATPPALAINGQRSLVTTVALTVTATSVTTARGDVRAITHISAHITALIIIGLMSHCVLMAAMLAIATSVSPTPNAASIISVRPVWLQIWAIIGTRVLPVHTVAMAMAFVMSVRPIPSVVSVCKSRSVSPPVRAISGLLLKLVPKAVLIITANAA
jgi:hypothetical protein